MGLGGGKKQKAPTVAPNTLRSRATAKILFLLCKGRIRGYANDTLGKSLFISGVPLQSPDGTNNYEGWQAYFRDGSPNQDYIPGLDSNTQVEAVGQLVRKDIDVVRTINDPDTDAVDVVIRIPSLFRVEDDGDVVGTSVHYQILLQAGSGNYQTVVDQIITDKTNSPYQRSHRIGLSGSSPWNVRVRRITADSTTPDSLQNATEWEYYTKVEYDRRSYSGYAVSGLHIDVEQLDSLDSGTALIYGKLMLVPHNYDPDARTYTGLFDGSLVLKWTNNPVWIALNILLERISLQAIRIYEFYEAAQYCDELVDGKPRFTFNHVFTQRKSAFATAREVVGTFNGKLIPRGTKVGLTVDKPKGPTLNFSTDEMAIAPEYQITSHLDIATVCTVTYREPEQDYAQISFVVRDEPGIARWGVRETNLDAIGCTSRNQAARSALWTLASPRLNAARVKFQLPLSGKLVQPGDVFTITDSRRDGRKASGRVVDFEVGTNGEGDRLTIDLEYSLNAPPYDLFLIGEDHELIAHEIDAIASTETSIVLTGNVAAELRPDPGDIWLIKPRNGVTGTPWRATEVAPVSSKPSHYDVEAVLYDPNKYSYIDSLGFLNAGNYQPRGSAALIKPPGTPFSPSAVTFQRTNANGESAIAVVVSWSYAIEDKPQLNYFELEYQKNNDPAWQPLATTLSQSYTVENAENAVHRFRVAAVNRIGLRSPWVETTTDIISAEYNPLAPPSVSGLTLSKLDANTVHLKWNPITTADVVRGGFFRIRHSPRIIDARWDSGTLVAKKPGNADEATLPYQEGTYMVRTYSSADLPSNVPSYATTNFSVLSDRPLRYLFDESSFAGVLENTRVIDGQLRLGSANSFNAIPAPFRDFPGPVNEWGVDVIFSLSGYYYFSSTYQVAASPIRFFLYPVIDVSIIDNDGSPVQNRDLDYGEFPSAKIEVSISTDGGSTYSDYFPLVPGEFYGTHVMARLLMRSDESNLSNAVSELKLFVF